MDFAAYEGSAYKAHPSQAFPLSFGLWSYLPALLQWIFVLLFFPFGHPSCPVSSRLEFPNWECSRYKGLCANSSSQMGNQIKEQKLTRFTSSGAAQQQICLHGEPCSSLDAGGVLCPWHPLFWEVGNTSCSEVKLGLSCTLATGNRTK